MKDILLTIGKIAVCILIIILIITYMAYHTDNTANTRDAYEGYECITIDSCEYLHGYYQLTHKGNCKFCEERRKKELEDLVYKLKGE